MSELLDRDAVVEFISIGVKALAAFRNPDDLVCVECGTVFNGFEQGEAYCHCDDEQPLGDDGFPF